MWVRKGYIDDDPTAHMSVVSDFGASVDRYAFYRAFPLRKRIRCKQYSISLRPISAGVCCYMHTDGQPRLTVV